MGSRDIFGQAKDRFNPWHSVSLEQLSTMVSFINLNKRDLPAPPVAVEPQANDQGQETNTGGLLSVLNAKKAPAWRSEQIMVQHSLQVSQQNIMSRSQPLHVTPFDAFLDGYQDGEEQTQPPSPGERVSAPVEGSQQIVFMEPPAFSFIIDEPQISITVDEPLIQIQAPEVTVSAPKFDPSSIIVSVEEPAADNKVCLF